MIPYPIISSIGKTLLATLLFASYSADSRAAIDTATINEGINNMAAMNNEKAIPGYVTLLQQCRQTGYRHGAIRVLNLLGQRYFSSGNDQDMIRCQHEAISLSRLDPKEYKQIALLYNNLGICYQSTLRYDSSLFYYQLAIVSQQQLGTVASKSLPFINLGLLYQRIGRIKAAARCYNRGRLLAEAEKDSGMMAAALLNTGGLYSSISDSFRVAERLLSQAITLVQDKVRPDIVHKAYYMMGVMAEKKGMHDLAVENYKKALRTPMGVRYDDLIPLISLGQVYIRQGKLKEADSILHAGLRQALSLNPLPDYLLDFYRYLAKANKQLNHYKLAAAYFDRFTELNDSLWGKGANDRIDELEAKNRQMQSSNERISQQLVITRQQALIKGNRLVMIISAITLVFLILLLLLYLRSRSIKQQKLQQRALWQATLQGEEKVRAAVARDLHDHIAGALTNIKTWFATLRAANTASSENNEYNGPLQELDQTIKDVRSIAHQLMPELLLHQGLAVAVMNHCQYVEKATAIKVGFRYLGLWDRSHKALELIIYRNIQELIQNAIRHSGTNKILVQLSCHQELLMVTVQDWGNGMPASADHSIAGMGLIQVRKSIEQLEGTFSISSKPGEGTSINFEIDLKTYKL
ncbi:ATP-binding protein [Chitinophaga sp. OAE865]|uniref:tetratricopeptide repeat-containing sensor histidine kinase n=1 Tax=Chitinophaga sp. OAE865 TaxID=2817898 RepID=UPI001AE9E895